MTKDQILALIATNKAEIARCEKQNAELGEQLIAQYPLGWIVVIKPLIPTEAPKMLRIGPLDPIEYEVLLITPSEHDGVPAVNVTTIPPNVHDDFATSYYSEQRPMRFGEERLVWEVQREDQHPDYAVQFFATEAEAQTAMLRPAQIMETRFWALVTCAATDRIPAQSVLCEVHGSCTSVEFGDRIALKLSAPYDDTLTQPRVKMLHIDLQWKRHWSEWYELIVGMPVTYHIPIAKLTYPVTVCCYATEAEARAAMSAPGHINNTPPA